LFRSLINEGLGRLLKRRSAAHEELTLPGKGEVGLEVVQLADIGDGLMVYDLLPKNRDLLLGGELSSDSFCHLGSPEFYFYHVAGNSNFA
jgi:hypothetical protein